MQKGSNDRYRDDRGTCLLSTFEGIPVFERLLLPPLEARSGREGNIFASVQFPYSFYILTYQEHFRCSVTAYLRSVSSSWVATDPGISTFLSQNSTSSVKRGKGHFGCTKSQDLSPSAYCLLIKITTPRSLILFYNSVFIIKWFTSRIHFNTTWLDI